ncbi:flagellar hook-associated protein FlgK [Desulfuromonas acetoxidans]|uniref:flagellar hook-associated protein FlgK n=1 Tax=Desulfuromonas acetoxidans TaxID=891 RepID=UPI002931AF20|nr:flagellar hook-associated protein FlgK [Desulfuromonas acetoxidans]
MDADLNELTENINVSIAAEVDTINQMADQIASLNLRIVSTEAGGTSANGLRDDRDQLLQELSELVGINTYEGGSGMVSVQLSSGLPLVEGGIASSMSSSRVDGLTTLSLDMGATTVELGLDDFGGEIKGLMSVRDNEIPQVRDSLDRLAYTLANEVNAVHEAGVDLDGNPGVSFFSYSTSTAADAEAWTGAAATLTVAITQTNQVAAGATSSSGDNTNTLAMVALQDDEVVDGSTFNEFYSQIASKVGLAVDQNTYELETAQDALVQVQNMRDSAVGVSTDEELLLLTQYQTGYRAAAQYINAINEMLDTMLTMGA